MPASIAGVLIGHGWFDIHHVICAFTSTICAPACIASVYSIAFIAAHRYFYIGQYALSMKYFSLCGIVIYMIFIWSLGFIIHIPNHVGWGTTRYSYMLRFCSIDTDLYSYAIFYALTVVLALVVTFVFYVKIYGVLRNSSLAKKMIVGGKNDKKENKTSHLKEWQLKEEAKIIRVSFRIYLVFFATWLPLTLLILSHLGDKVPPWTYLLAGLLAHCNSTLNFIFYFLSDDMFKKGLRRLCLNFLPACLLAKIPIKQDLNASVWAKKTVTSTPVKPA